ncbi:hypothetical protein F4780DRAFT_797280 [Xylariomycetidae sp. FL0641]|nr:hypothetical protein F4780DRAFT_797280 [Xylariomycetidae sp. FL0641]
MTAKYAKDQPEGFTNRIERVAIVGAGGRMGSHIAEHLLATGRHTVTALTRPGSTSALPAGVRVARVDYTRADDDGAGTVVAALRGQQVLLITLAVTAPPETTVRLARAAAAAGVGYVLPNWYGHDAAHDALCADSALLGMRDPVVAELAGSTTTRWLRLVCGSWYEFGLGGGPARFGFDLAARTLVRYDDVPVNVSTWAQCGRAVARLLSLPELPRDAADAAPALARWAGANVYVASFRLTQRDMLDSVLRVTGAAPADWTVVPASAEARWREARDRFRKGDFTAFTQMLYARLFFPGGGADYESTRGLDNEVLGLPVEDLDECTAVAVRMAENNEVVGNH